MNMGNDTMKAVVFKGPGKVAIEERPVPKIQDQTDIIVKVDKVPQPRSHQLHKLIHGRQRFVAGMLHVSTSSFQTPM